jgi:hypothetical protein
MTTHRFYEQTADFGQRRVAPLAEAVARHFARQFVHQRHLNHKVKPKNNNNNNNDEQATNSSELLSFVEVVVGLFVLGA